MPATVDRHGPQLENVEIAQEALSCTKMGTQCELSTNRHPCIFALRPDWELIEDELKLLNSSVRGSGCNNSWLHLLFPVDCVH